MAWENIRTLAAVVSAICAIIAAGVSLMVLHRARSGDLTAKITKGDREVKQHTDRAISGINHRLATMDGRMGEIEEGVGRIGQQQQHNLTARDLSPIHEKINRVGENLAANTATTKAVHEQLGVIHRYMMRGNV